MNSSCSIISNDSSVVNMLIEIPYGSNVKYEIKNGVTYVDRVLHHASMIYPFNYGYIPETLADDGDELDAVLLSEVKFYPGVYIKCRIIGVLITRDEKGMDEKILLVPVSNVDPSKQHINDITDLSEMDKNYIQHFFENYKKFEKNKWVELLGFENKEKALEIYRKSQEIRIKIKLSN